MAHFRDSAEAVRIVANVPGEFGHIDIALSIEGKVGRTLCIGPLLEEFTVRAEYLDSVDFAVAHEYPPVGGNCDTMRQPEMAGTVAGLPPRALQRPAGGKHVNGGITIAGRAVDVALGADGDVGRAVEGRPCVPYRARSLAIVTGVGWHV